MKNSRIRAAAGLAMLALGCRPLTGWSADVQPATATATTAATKAATAAQKRKSEAKGLALAKETVQRISEAQMAVADRVLVGEAQCEFNQSVSVHPIKGQPAHFRVGFKKAHYTMVPQETTTGAVRLEDKKAGMVWLQIPVKSMLMNARIGQRMVDACTHSEQRAAVAAAEAAAQSASAASASKN